MGGNTAFLNAAVITIHIWKNGLATDGPAAA